MILLDTHVILWVLKNDERLSPHASPLLRQENSFVFSMVSLWEMGIKLGIKKLNFTLNPDWASSIPQTLTEYSMRRIDIIPDHCKIIADLPLHHHDPFDRMLIAQALQLGDSILSVDDKFDTYPIQRIW
ncbi:MAG: type II toxin-antitoxin system VapC family toxin [Verrucomicrobiota bacterium]